MKPPKGGKRRGGTLPVAQWRGEYNRGDPLSPTAPRPPALRVAAALRHSVPQLRHCPPLGQARCHGLRGLVPHTASSQVGVDHHQRLSPVAPHRPPLGRARWSGLGGLVPRTPHPSPWRTLRSPITELSPCASCPRWAARFVARRGHARARCACATSGWGGPHTPARAE